MKTAAVIAEYNPFHNGHRYHLEETRRKTGADFILAVMSGNFVQRGAPAILDKYTRAKMALLNGADAVIELPALYALSSAEFFAGGAVTLLNQLNVIDVLSFGSESENLPLLKSCAHLLVEKEEELRTFLKAYLKKGNSYPAARAQALANVLSAASTENPFYITERLSPETFTEFLSSPNNILGLEYCKALFVTGSSIKPFTLRRTDRGYHSTSMEAADSGIASGFASASAIRHALELDTESDAFFAYVPENTHCLFAENFSPVTENSFSHLLHYKLLSESSAGFSEYLDCTPDLSDKICKNLPDFTDFSGFCSLLKSKELTYTRISRVLMHILLNIKTPEFFKFSLKERAFFVPYAKLLGFRQGAEPLLAAIKKNSTAPLLSKLSDARFLLSEEALSLLQQDVYCSCVYESALTHLTGEPIANEWKTSPVIV